MKSTIGRKIIFAFFIVLVLMGIMVVITFQGLNKVVSSLDEIEIEAVKRGASGNLRFSIAQLLMPSNDYIITEKDHYRSEYNQLNSYIDDFYRQLIQLPLTEEEQQLVIEIKQDLDSIRAYSVQIFSIQHPRQSPEAWALMETMDYRFGSDVNLKTTQIFNGISHRIEAHRLQAAANKTNASNSIYGIMFLAILITLVVSYLTVQRIAKPIVIVTKAANGIANGDYSQRPIVKTHDEIAVLAQSFSIMADSIQKTQHALEESKKLTEAIVATVPVGLLVFDSNGKILSVNNSFCNFFGLFQDLFLYQNIKSLFDTLNVTDECRDHILLHDTIRDVECCYFDPEKRKRIFNLTIIPLELTDSESLLILEDITKRKYDEQIINDSEKRFRSLVENSMDGLGIIDSEGILIYESPANEKISGYKYGELISQNAFSLIHQDDYPFIMNLFKELLKDSSKVISTEFRIRHKNETIRWIEATAKNLLDDSIIGGVVVNFRDITERKRAEEELLRIGTAVEQTADCVVITDKNGVTQYVNKAFTKITGYSREEAIGKTPSILKSGQLPPKFYETLWATIISGEVFTATILNKRKDGELIYELKTITPVKDKKGNITHFVSTAKDITEQRRAEEELHRKEEHHKAVVESIFKFVPEGVLVLTESMNLLKHNKAFDNVVQKYAPMLGYTEQELAEKIIEQLRSKILSGDTTEIHVPKKSE